MDWSTIQNSWNDYKGDAQKQWSKLTDDEINSTMGNRDHLSGRLQEAYEMSEDDADRQIDEWQARQMEKPKGAAKN